jgi:hypothetical protein
MLLLLRPCRLIRSLLLLTVPPFAFGQGERATITGTVTDSTKATVPEATVTIRNVSTNVVTHTTTNSAGLYFITSIPPGTYDLTVEKVASAPRRSTISRSPPDSPPRRMSCWKSGPCSKPSR